MFACVAVFVDIAKGPSIPLLATSIMDSIVEDGWRMVTTLSEQSPSNEAWDILTQDLDICIPLNRIDYI